MPVPFPVYRPRNPQQTPYYRCVEDHLKTLEQVYEDRFESLLLELSRCIWETLKIYYPSCLPGKNSVPGAVIALQTFGDFLGFNPHGHVLITDGCFPEKGLFVVAPTVKLKYLEKIFRSKIFTLLLAKGKITPDLIKLLKSWRHSGFQVFCGPRIHPRGKASMENLARYIIRASFSQERMIYPRDETGVRYLSKDNRQQKAFEALGQLVQFKR